MNRLDDLNELCDNTDAMVFSSDMLCIDEEREFLKKFIERWQKALHEHEGVKTVFDKVYDGESLYDLSRDIGEAFIEEYNDLLKDIPKDEYGIQSGTFTVKAEWKPSNE